LSDDDFHEVPSSQEVSTCTCTVHNIITSRGNAALALYNTLSDGRSLEWTMLVQKMVKDVTMDLDQKLDFLLSVINIPALRVVCTRTGFEKVFSVFRPAGHSGQSGTLLNDGLKRRIAHIIKYRCACAFGWSC
jgi:hypothetical protein